MNQKISYLLCSTVHDPQFRLKSFLESTLPMINNLFSKKILCCTPSSGDRYQNFLVREGFEVITCNSTKNIDTYKLALKTTLNYIDNPSKQNIFFIDFDRLIHWIHSFPNEITEILQKEINVDYLLIGRTPRAFDTHPSTQKDTENIVNEIGSKILGFSDIKDLISVCSIFTKELAEKILKADNTTATGFYGTWPILLWQLAPRKQYVEMEGLEWETPDRFTREIKKRGYNSWLKQYQSTDEWEKRVRYLHEFLLELSKITEFKFLNDLTFLRDLK